MSGKEKSVINEELKLMNFRDTVKIVADSPKVVRETVLNGVGDNGYSLRISIIGPMEDHPLKAMNKASLLEAGLYDLVITGPKKKQTEITDFYDEYEAEEE